MRHEKMNRKYVMSHIGELQPVALVLAATNHIWKFCHGFPIPKQNLKCGACFGKFILRGEYSAHDREYSPLPIVRDWEFHTRGVQSRTVFRCDVTMKCQVCGCVWRHGVVLTEEQWRKQVDARTLVGAGAIVSRDQFLEIVDALGGAEE
jgi:hypothetical protein